MKDHIEKYLNGLQKEMCDCSTQPYSIRSIQVMKEMGETWLTMRDVMCKLSGWGDGDAMLTAEQAHEWTAHMENADGTTGAHWTNAQTTSVAESIGVKFDHISEWCWNAAMNMMYSDYCGLAKRYNVDKPDFYAEMAKAFLFDKDGGEPKQKIAAYYQAIAKPAME